MKKTTLLIVFTLFLSVCSFHLPWIYDECIEGMPPPVKRIEYWYWSFMARRIIYRTNYFPETQYVLFDNFWNSWGIVPNMGRILTMFATGNFSLDYLWEGYYIIFMFQILTVLFLIICIVTERRDAPLQQVALYITTFFISLGAPIVGVNQYAQDWGFGGGRAFVQFEIGFYLAVVSSVLTLAYGLNFIIKIFRE